MKKVLFATTALIASAGIAAADGHSSVTVGGYGFAGVKDDGSSSDVISKVRITFGASVETDAGVTFGASARMNISDNAGNIEANALERGKVSMSANGLTVAVGATNGAMRSLARAATFYGFDDGGTIGFDNSVSDDQADGGNNVYASYATGGLTFGISSDVAGTTTEIGVQYAAGAFTVGLAASDTDSIMLMGKYSSDTLDAFLSFGDDSDDTTETVLGLSYDVSSTSEISVAIADNGGTESFGLQYSYDLGGASLVAAVGDNGTTEVASLGVIFSF